MCNNNAFQLKEILMRHKEMSEKAKAMMRISPGSVENGKFDADVSAHKSVNVFGFQVVIYNCN